jgi:hypothetical protein
MNTIKARYLPIYLGADIVGLMLLGPLAFVSWFGWLAILLFLFLILYHYSYRVEISENLIQEKQILHKIRIIKTADIFLVDEELFPTSWLLGYGIVGHILKLDDGSKIVPRYALDLDFVEILKKMLPHIKMGPNLLAREKILESLSIPLEKMSKQWRVALFIFIALLIIRLIFMFATGR